MNKKNIGAVLLKGAPKQRAKLLAEEIARATYNLDSLLSETEFFNLPSFIAGSFLNNNFRITFIK